MCHSGPGREQLDLTFGGAQFTLGQVLPGSRSAGSTVQRYEVRDGR